MSQSKLDVYLHFVWATKYREPMIGEAETHDLYGVIGGEVRRMRGEVLAIGGMPDHVHLFVRFGRSVSFGQFMNQVKGVSSAFINERRRALSGENAGLFRWQSGYGVFSVGHNQVRVAAAYVKNQPRHHAAGEVWKQWEWAGEADSAAEPSAAEADATDPNAAETDDISA